MLDLVVLGSGLAIYRRLRMRSKVRTVTGGALIAASFGVFALATLLWASPYRLLFQADVPRLSYAGQRCYELGRQEGEVLIYCPENQQPKVRRVLENDRQLQATGITENIYSPR